MEKKESLQTPFYGNGKELQGLFDPRIVMGEKYPHNSLEGVSEDFLSGLVSEARKHLHSECQRGCTGEVKNNNGQHEVNGSAVVALRRSGGAVANLLANPDVVQLPGIKRERQAFSKTLINAALHNDGVHRIVAPVCPEYGSGEGFYRSMGGGISPEARAAINATKVLSAGYSDYLSPKVTILVADTEDDIEEIMGNTVSGDTLVYKANCEASVDAIRSEFEEGQRVEVLTFSQYLGLGFRQLQGEAEELLSTVMQKNDHVYEVITKVAEQRVARHSQILARPEKAYELTIRYMAQYMALGEIMRMQDLPTMLMNYATPNRAFYNASANIHPDLGLSSKSNESIPVIGTFARR